MKVMSPVDSITSREVGDAFSLICRYLGELKKDTTKDEFGYSAAMNLACDWAEIMFINASEDGDREGGYIFQCPLCGSDW